MGYQPVYGFDVSHYNAISDAHAAYAQGNRFAWCKATEGTSYVDPTFHAKVEQLRNAGFVVGAYGFVHGNVGLQAQAEHFRDTARNAGCLDDGALMPMCDLEAADARGNANHVLAVWYDVVGVTPQTAYANLDWWSNVLRRNQWGNRSIWGTIARYNGHPGAPGWDGDPKMAMHQHTDGANKHGIAGRVDGDVSIEDWTMKGLTIGGKAAPPNPGPKPQPPQAGDTWTVRKGDTLSRIASAWGETVSAVAAANGVPNPDSIYVGQTIHKPGTGPAPKPPQPNGGLVVVHSGDTLSAIARTHHTTVPAIVTANHIANPDRIYVGQQLRLPQGSGNAPAGNRTYTVKAGDTLGAIAAKLHYPGGYIALAKHNSIGNPNHVAVGQKIRY